MKQKILTTILMLLLVPLALALEPEVEAGITPDSSFYGLDIFFDNLRVAFTTNVAEKARVRLEIAQERVAEMKQMAQENKLQSQEKARVQERLQIQEVENLVEEMVNGEKVDIQQRLQKHIIILKDVFEKVSEQAKEGIQKAIDSSSKVFDNVQTKIPSELRESKEEIRIKIEQGEVEIRIRQIFEVEKGENNNQNKIQGGEN